MCIHFWHPLLYVCVCVCVCLYIYRGAKKFIHILRDVIYVLRVYIFLAPSVYIRMYVCIYVSKLLIKHPSYPSI